MNLPIVFIHRGYSSYLEFSLRQAKFMNADSEIILLGDASNNKFDFVTHVNIQDYFKQAEDFAKIYKHYSTNPYTYELFCFQRWFILSELMTSKAYKEVFVCDSDILLYSNVDELAKNYFNNYDFGASIHSEEISSAEVSFWRLEIVHDFCSFMIKSYSNELSLLKIREFYESLQAQKELGGYCDMSIIHDYIKQFTGKLANIQHVIQDAACDSNIGSPIGGSCEYKFKYGKKKFLWKNNFPYCYNKDLGKNIKFLLIHFQGPAKYLMASYYTGPAFKGILALKFKFSWLNFMAFWYKTLNIRYRFAWLFNFIFNLTQRKR